MYLTLYNINDLPLIQLLGDTGRRPRDVKSSPNIPISGSYSSNSYEYATQQNTISNAQLNRADTFSRGSPPPQSNLARMNTFSGGKHFVCFVTLCILYLRSLKSDLACEHMIIYMCDVYIDHIRTLPFLYLILGNEGFGDNNSNIQNNDDYWEGGVYGRPSQHNTGTYGVCNSVYSTSIHFTLLTLPLFVVEYFFFQPSLLIIYCTTLHYRELQ